VFEREILTGNTFYLGIAVEVSVMKVTQSWVCGGDVVIAATRDGVI
jgi:hypothetical protein